MSDPRRLIPRTDALLTDPRLQPAIESLGLAAVKRVVVRAQQQARDGFLDPADVLEAAVGALPPSTTSMRAVINATGVVLHTNLGRAALSEAAVAAMTTAAGYVDVEFDRVDGRRARRGRGALDALRAAVPDAQDVLIVNNGAAALVLCTTALGGDVVISRGELVEIGDGFRLPDLIRSTGAAIREVGTTNRTHLADYEQAINDDTRAVLKIHPSNFRIEGFTADVGVRELATLGPAVIVDIGSGLLHPEPLLPAEPDVTTTLRAGADLVTCSGDKLFGGPQAGLVFGRADLIERVRRHPLARALRVDKLTLAALEATLAGAPTPTTRYLHADRLYERCRAVAAALVDAGLVDVDVVESAGAVGGGGAPGVTLPGWAVALPERDAGPLRRGRVPVVGRIENGRCLLDLRCVEPADDARVIAAVKALDYACG